jgi:hypothetical protein
MPKTAHPLYKTWDSMRRRCWDENSWNYKDYGARGIRTCERWLTFENFTADVGERPEGKELDRPDNGKDYGPDNWRWATRTEQVNNTRTRKDNACGVKGIAFLQGKQRWVAYANVQNSRWNLYHGKDFFEACCARKSWDAQNA